jgi:hypothetical protein
MNNTAFPNREIILSAMGFTEPPLVNGTEQMLYYIISHSMWFGDIINRYMPNYKSDLLLNSILNNNIENPEDMIPMNPMYSYERYLQCSLLEYGKLSRYMTHCSSRGLGLELFEGDFSVFIENNESVDFTSLTDDNFVDEENIDFGVFSEASFACGGKPPNNEGLRPELFNSIQVPLNKQKVRCIRRTRMSILHFKKSIQDNVDLLRSLESFLHDISFTPLNIYNDVISATTDKFITQDNVQQYIDLLDEKRVLIQQQIEKCRLIQQIRTDLKNNLENLHKYRLKDDLNMRSVEFCMPELKYFPVEDTKNVLTTNIDDWSCLPCVPRLISPYFKRNVNRSKNLFLPDELMCLIRSFIGEEILHSARRKCVMDRYFPEGSDNIVKMLKQWRNIDLIKFSEQVFLRYNVNYDRKRWRRVALRKSSNKTLLIENLINCNYRCTFFEFLRDIFFLTRIFDTKRGYRGGRGH